MAGLLDYYFILKFVKELVTPFTKTKAYQLGIIDEDGNILKSMDDLETPEEKKAYTYTNRLIWNLKKLLGKVPGGKTTIASFAAAAWLLKEEGYCSSTSLLCEEIEKNIPLLINETVELENINIDSIYKLKYTIDENTNIGDTIIVLSKRPINSVLGINIYECVNITKKQYMYIPCNFITINEELTTTAALPDASDVKRNTFAGIKVFPVKGKTYCRCLQGKKKYARWSNYLDLEDDCDKEILNYAKRNPKKEILVKSLTDGSMVYLKNNNR